MVAALSVPLSEDDKWGKSSSELEMYNLIFYSLTYKDCSVMEAYYDFILSSRVNYLFIILTINLCFCPFII